jgi:hypothetical protein
MARATQSRIDHAARRVIAANDQFGFPSAGMRVRRYALDVMSRNNNGGGPP